ncbi:hypothetical protein KC929_01890 [Patescibacteria group bacterium]|nr:hypothetical protein [Patescibacteria group bacterium]
MASFFTKEQRERMKKVRESIITKKFILKNGKRSKEQIAAFARGMRVTQEALDHTFNYTGK